MAGALAPLVALSTPLIGKYEHILNTFSPKYIMYLLAKSKIKKSNNEYYFTKSA
jgi:hypothetical protein